MRLIKEKLGDYAELTGCIHEPDKEMGNIECFPTILVLPGGGFRFCSAREAEPVAMAYFAEGYQAFTLKYTTVTDKPDAVITDPMEDVMHALAWLRGHEAEYYMAPGQLAMIGFSGGAHLASAVATHGPQRQDVLLLGYPGILHRDLRALECPDIIECVDVSTPPTFMFGTRDDNVTPPKHPLAFAQALDKAGVDYEIHIFKCGEHGLSLAKPLTCGGDRKMVNPSVAPWFDMSVRWLKDQFGEFAIYGVNDGRIGKFSIDTVLEELFCDAAAEKILLKMIPAAEQMKGTQFAGWLCPRKLEGNVPGVTKELLKDLDRRLLAL